METLNHTILNLLARFTFIVMYGIFLINAAKSCDLVDSYSDALNEEVACVSFLSENRVETQSTLFWFKGQ